MNVLAGQTIRLRIGSEATVPRLLRLRLTGSNGTNTVQIPLVRVGGENGLLNKARVEGGIVSGFDFGYDQGEVLLDPGDCVDVVATFPPTATGVFTLWEKNFGAKAPAAQVSRRSPSRTSRLTARSEPDRRLPTTARRFSRRSAPAPKSRCSGRRPDRCSIPGRSLRPSPACRTRTFS